MSPRLDPHIWRACVGTASKLPVAGTQVYYFPHGHSEQSLTPIALPISKPYCLCRVSSVALLADPDTDEAFASIRLHPIAGDPRSEVFESAGEGGSDGGEVVSFAKVLTPSDANNGGGFSVPRFCADSIFPPLDFCAEPPVQNIAVRDAHGVDWDFRHIYRGTPRRHLLTTGWSRFVSCKKLVAGDSVVFIKNKTRPSELSVGIRRAGRSGRVPAETIAEAVRLMESDRPFEVMYYPRVGLAEFVVEKENVERATAVCWTAGMRVKMSLETGDLSRMGWFQGTVSSVAAAANSAARLRSPWRMLQVTWDEPEVLQNVKTVSPWQVELLSASSYLQSAFPSIKKPRISHCLDLSSEGQLHTFYPNSIFESTKLGSLDASLFDYKTFPVGIQGARHDIISSLSNLIPTNSHHFSSEKPYGIKMHQELNVSHSEGASSPSQETMDHNSLDLFGLSACNPKRKAGKGYFQLFGRVIIPMCQPSDDDENDSVGNQSEVLSLDFSLA